MTSVKAVLMTALIGLSAHAQASTFAKQTYENLGIASEATCKVGPCPNAAVTLQKSVGGLTCFETSYVIADAEPTYSCRLSTPLDAKAIFSALDVTAVDTCSTANCPNSITTTEKVVGPLRCTETSSMVYDVEPRYSCEVTF